MCTEMEEKSQRLGRWAKFEQAALSHSLLLEFTFPIPEIASVRGIGCSDSEFLTVFDECYS